MVDATVGWTAQHEQLLEKRPADVLIVLNKVDQLASDPQSRSDIQRLSAELSTRGASVVMTSAVQSGGIDSLLSRIGEHIDQLLPPPGSGVPISPVQVQATEGLRSRIQRQLSA